MFVVQAFRATSTHLRFSPQNTRLHTNFSKTSLHLSSPFTLPSIQQHGAQIHFIRTKKSNFLSARSVISLSPSLVQFSSRRPSSSSSSSSSGSSSSSSSSSSSPFLSPSRGTRFFRNAIIAVLFCGAIYIASDYFKTEELKSTMPFKLSFELVKRSEEVQKLLGTPIESGSSVTRTLHGANMVKFEYSILGHGADSTTSTSSPSPASPSSPSPSASSSPTAKANSDWFGSSLAKRGTKKRSKSDLLLHHQNSQSRNCVFGC
eukprot:TRINITY_DN3529_c0_g6_i1.p1 TRINITY_DN3529_c0_g6~~TRINITY_DN3529_c0_g6_i1.p1  ORF type:complete len:273 (-),score=88.86 TRINITY_DN3529_c0_g6_i1:157-939(-)